MIAAEEPWLRVASDSSLPELFLAYGEEYGVVCDPDWPRARRMASVGDLHAFTLRDDNRLVGFCFVQLWPQLAFKGETLALASELYIDPAYRGGGMKLLLDKAIECMRSGGATRFALHHSMQNPAVLAPLGSGVSMRVWVKDL